jgi:hypothetical protein
MLGITELSVLQSYQLQGGFKRSYCIFQFGRLSQVEIQRRPELPDSIWKSSEHVIESKTNRIAVSII